jgi:hypothetical protein
MMRALGNYIMRGRFHAATVVGLLTVVSWFLVPLAYLLGGVPLGLVTLRRGELIGIQVIAASFLLVVAVALLAGLGPALAAGFAAGVWLPVWFCALVLRRSESQAGLLLAAGAIGVAFIVGMRLSVPDTEGWWHDWLVSWLDGNVPQDAAAQYREFVDRAAPLFNGMMGAGLAMSLITTLLLARWWQSLLFNPGGFRSEFYGMALPRWLGALLVVGAAPLLLLEGVARNWLRDLLFVVLLLYLFQGLAAVHRTVAARGLSGLWLVTMYGLLLLLPQMALFIACVGLADSWMGRRPAAPPAAGH